MARLDEQRRALAMNIRFERAAENELTPAQARLFVRSLQTSWQVPPIAWGPRESHEQFEDARRRLHGAGIFRELMARARRNLSAAIVARPSCLNGSHAPPIR
jgi:hypothetical protein